MKQQPCHFCGSDSEIQRASENGGLSVTTFFKCPVCGEHGVTELVLEDTRGEEFLEQKAKISAVLAERSHFPKSAASSPRPIVYLGTDGKIEQPGMLFLRWSDLLARFPETVGERLERAVANLARLSKTPGAALRKEIRAAEGWREVDLRWWRAVLFAETDDAAIFVKDQLLLDKVIKLGAEESVILTAKGWGIFSASETGKGNRASKVAFVAMNFARAYQKCFDAGLKLGIERAGFVPRRVDGVVTNGRIDDQIIAEIRRCRFVVADFSGHRPSVYWEAGFATGLGVPVIHTCSAGDLKKLAFDTRQTSHIKWRSHAALANELFQRIRATIF